MFYSNYHRVLKIFPQALKMWLWHALEENEHKTVAYDVYEQVVGSYALRTVTMIPTTIILFAVMAYFQTLLLAADGQLLNVRQNIKGFRFLFGYKKGLFPKLIPQFFDFFKKDFHPSQHDTTALLEQWRTLLFSKEEGMLYQQVKNKVAVGLH